MAARRSRRRKSRGIAWRLILVAGKVVAGYYIVCTLLLFTYLFVFPPLTGVQLQRSIEYLVRREPVVFEYDPVPASEISEHLRHAAVAAEDTRFYEHWGVDWQALREAVEDNLERGEVYRGGSTITQQLVKNLFMTTHSSFIRKAFEVPLTFLCEIILPKDRILTLYLNVIEWGPGIYGAEAAARHYFGGPARELGRRQSASLAAVIPNPRRRTPAGMGRYTGIILRRMQQMGY